jgi:hypothetical protein
LDQDRRLIHINALAMPSPITSCMNHSSDDDRERSLKGESAFDRSFSSAVAIRRNVLLGRWAAIRMGLHGKAAEDYIADLAAIEEEDERAVPRAIVARVMNDLLAHGVPAKRLEIESEIRRLTAKARAQIVRGTLR